MGKTFKRIAGISCTKGITSLRGGKDGAMTAAYRVSKRTTPLLCILCALFALFFFLLSIAAPAYTARAVEPFDSAAQCSLTLSYRYGNTALSDVHTRVYRVASMSESVRFTPAEAFAGYSVKLNGLTAASQWNAAAQTLAGYVLADQVEPAALGSSDAQGTISFTGLPTGLYLVAADTRSVGKTKYSFSPFLLALPNRTGNGPWDYDVSALPKGDMHTTGGGGGTTVSRSVEKVWADQGHEESRTPTVTVDILKDGVLYSTKVLSQENGWAFTWSAPDDGSEWQAVERNVTGAYYVTAAGEGTAITVKNSYIENIDDEPVPVGTVPPTIDISDDPVPLGGLLQTGQLWWPVPLLAGIGLLLFGAGWLATGRPTSEKNGNKHGKK